MAYTSAKNATQDLSVLIRNGTHTGASLRFALKADSFAISYSKTYYLPFKNWLENTVYDWIASDAATGQLELEVGDTNHPQTDSSTKGYTGTPILINTASLSSWTGGSVYRVAIQMARFQLNPSREDRYDFSMQLVSGARQDWIDKAELD